MTDDVNTTPIRLMIVATHPIQYQAPWFRALAGVPGLDIDVVFIQQLNAREQGRGFGVSFQWDLPLREGYPSRWADGVRGPGGLGGFFSTRLSSPAQLLCRRRPDALILTGWHAWPLVQLVWAAGRLRIPVIMRGESNAFRQRSRMAAFFHRLLLARCQAFLTIGQGNTAFYQGYGVGDERLFPAPYFVENRRFQSAAVTLGCKRQGLRGEWQVPPEAVCFLYAGKLEPKKRIFDLLDALGLAVRGGALNLHLLVVGTGELMGEARRKVVEQGLPVTFAGFLNQTEMPSAYVAADCLVLPSDYGETWGLVVNEAMACGRPALVSDRVGCGPDLVTPGVTGEVFPFGDVPALAARLVALAQDRQRLVAMGEAAQARVLRDYSVERAVEGVKAAVAAVTGRALA